MINAYLNFPGTCAEAFRAYEKIFGGKIAFMTKFGESPMKIRFRRISTIA